MKRWLRSFAVLIVLTVTSAATLDSQQPPGASALPGALKDVELTTPFRVAEVKGTILSARRQPLEAAGFSLELGPGPIVGSTIHLGASTDATGSFEVVGPRNRKIGPGTYRFKAWKEGFHSTVGAVIISPDAPTDSVIEVELQPGPDADDRTPEQRASDWDRLQLPVCPPGANRNPKRRKYPGAVVEMPVSLGGCAVRTPEVTVVKKSEYRLLLEIDGSLEIKRTICMLGTFSGPFDRQYNNCLDTDPLLKADWTVWQGDQAVARGSSPLEDHATFAKNSRAKIMGRFFGEAGKKYVVEVKFLKDGSAINAANPHLIVQRW